MRLKAHDLDILGRKIDDVGMKISGEVCRGQKLKKRLNKRYF